MQAHSRCAHSVFTRSPAGQVGERLKTWRFPGCGTGQRGAEGAAAAQRRIHLGACDDESVRACCRKWLKIAIRALIGPNWPSFYAHRNPRRIALAALCFRRQKASLWGCIETRDFARNCRPGDHNSGHFHRLPWAACLFLCSAVTRHRALKGHVVAQPEEVMYVLSQPLQCRQTLLLISPSWWNDGDPARGRLSVAWCLEAQCMSYFQVPRVPIERCRAGQQPRYVTRGRRHIESRGADGCRQATAGVLRLTN